MLTIGRKASVKGSDRSSRMGCWALAAAAALTSASLLGEAVFAAPQGGKVTVGTGSIQTQGTATTIRASDGAVIQYSSFNLVNGESVRFIQPSATSAVLNRIVGATPTAAPAGTTIDGAITANGRVYFVNPSGVIFGPHAVINVASLYAAAGDITNANFKAGNNLFTIAKGTLVNQGTIQAGDTGQVNLLGYSVLNSGTIVAPRGVATMTSASGDVLISEVGGQIAVKVSKPAAAEAAGSTPDINNDPAGTQNNGTIKANGGMVKMIGAGDVYTLAVKNAGLVSAAVVTMDSGNRTAVVAGRISTNSQGASQAGGNVTVTGDRVVLNGATIDASGVTGGGNVKIGGDFHGGSTVPQSRRTGIMPGSTISVDGTGYLANGGTVVVWSTEYTYFNGRISARAVTGNGGFIEVSSRGTLVAPGAVDAGSQMGIVGAVLYDPQDIVIHGGNGSGTDGDANNATIATATPGSILFGTAPAGGTFDVWQSEIQGQSATANIVLQATKTITISAVDNVFAGGKVTLAAGRSLTMQTTGGNIDLVTNVGAGNLEFVTSGIGGITIQASMGGAVPGNVTLNKLTAGSGGILVSTDNGIITASQAITTTGSTSLQAAGAIAVNNSISATTSVSIASGTSGVGDLGFGAPVTVSAPSISLRAGSGAGAAAKVDTVTSGPTFAGLGGAGSPTTFSFRQDKSIGDAGAAGDIPAAARFGAAIPANYTIQSDGGSVTVATPANVAGSALALNGSTGVAINSNLNLASLAVTGNLTFGAATTAVTTTTTQQYNGTVALGNNTTLTGTTLTAGAVTGGGNDLTLNGGAGGVVTLASVSGVGTLTVTNSGGTTVNGTTGATTVTLT
ncbi:MAG: filamentous hemagglutinin N-terminal domain-containing protein, partial [Tepidisphaeraceae bacterium]